MHSHRFSVVLICCLLVEALTMSTSGSAFSGKQSGGGKNLVVLSDGTGMELKGMDKNSNVLRLLRVLSRNDDEQRVYYDPGIGTVKSINPWSILRAKFSSVFGLATGQGLDEAVLSAYTFLMTNYKEGDRIYLFGFSRGAYTMRVLAGFIHVVGLLHQDQENILPYALVAYKEAGNEYGGIPKDYRSSIPKEKLKAEAEAKRLGKLSGARQVDIHFVGVWDTVNSVVVPRPDRFFIPSIQKLPYTRGNPSVTNFRHACAIDERRRMFRVNKWLFPNGEKVSTEDGRVLKTSTKQVWFPGCHGDVGGGWAEERSGLAKHAMKWMVDEATQEGIKIDNDLYKKICLGEGECGPTVIAGDVACSPPNSLGPINHSLTLAWKPLEIFPKGTMWKEWNLRWSFLGFYIPWAEPRPIPAHHELHFSVRERMEGDPTYRPPNVMAYLKEVEESDSRAPTEVTPLA